jgi:hypothetical protein
MLSRSTIAVIAVTALIVALPSRNAEAQARPQADVYVGTWQGVIRTPAAPLRIGLRLQRDTITGGLRGSLTSIDQGNQVLPLDVGIAGDSVIANIAAAGVRYSAKLSARGDSLFGTWQQGGARTPLDMGRVSEFSRTIRPQDPRPPFPYSQREVAFESVAGVRLAGTVTIPEGAGPFPAVVLVSGSGPQDRDESIAGHRPFLVLADHLARRGIASLRNDDRGTALSTGNFAA